MLMFCKYMQFVLIWWCAASAGQRLLHPAFLDSRFYSETLGYNKQHSRMAAMCYEEHE